MPNYLLLLSERGRYSVHQTRKRRPAKNVRVIAKNSEYIIICKLILNDIKSIFDCSLRYLVEIFVRNTDINIKKLIETCDMKTGIFRHF